MQLAEQLQIALKEWDVVVQALATGRQMILLRKGGIYESAGEFELEHPQFLFFPTYLHQNLNMLKPDAHVGFEPRSVEPERITLSTAGVVTDIVRLKSRAQMDALDDQHIWTKPLIDMRFNYRPENPLYLMLVRAHRPAQPVTVNNTRAYAGCKSWVPLEEPVSTSNAKAVIDDEAFGARRGMILRRLEENV